MNKQNVSIILLIALMVFILTIILQGTPDLSGMMGSFLTAIVCVFFIWMLYRLIKDRPELFSKAALGKSFGTMGWLALALIGGIGLVIMLLKQPG